MSACRFLHDNLLSNPAMITPSSAQPGLVGMPVANSSGTAVAYATGAHTGGQDQVFLLEIDSLAGGNQVEQASFRWRRGTAPAWEETGVPTCYNLRHLADGVQIKWSSGQGADFVLGDAWTILATRAAGAAALLDTDRDTAWQALGCADESLDLDLGQEQEALALVLGDHNLGSGAVVTLLAGDNPGLAAPSLSLSLPVASPHLTAFFQHSARYWRLRLQDPDNPQAALRAGGLYLGGYFQPSRMFSAGYTTSLTAGRSTTSTDAGKTSGHATGLAQSWQISFSGLTAQDMAGFQALHRAVHDTESGLLSPFYFTPFVELAAQDNGSVYCLPGESLSGSHQHMGRYSLSLSLSEMVRTHV